MATTTLSFARGAANKYTSSIANYSGCIYFDTTNKKIMLNGVTYGGDFSQAISDLNDADAVLTNSINSVSGRVSTLEAKQTLTGSGTSNYLPVWTGTASLGSKVAFGTSTSKFLAENGTWVTPSISASDTKVTSRNLAENEAPLYLLGHTASGNASALLATQCYIEHPIDLNEVLYAPQINVGGQLIVSEENNDVWMSAHEHSIYLGEENIQISTVDTSIVYSNDIGIEYGDQDTTYFSISPSGSVSAYSFYEMSDADLKKNIEPISVNVDDLAKLPKVMYNWKPEDSDDPKHIGTIAQEVEKLYPDLVNTNVDGVKSVDYAKLSILALAAIDQLNERIKVLESK